MLRNPMLFPWGSDDEAEARSERCSQSPGDGLDASENELALEVGSSDPIYWRLPNPTALAGKILEHCEAVIQHTRLETGGLQLAIYKIGITHECSARFALYSQKGWDKMVVMYKSEELGSIEMLATAKHVVTLAETFTGEDDDCKALQAMAKCPKSDAERALQIILRKFDMTLNVPTTQKTFAGVQVPVLLPEDFIRTLSDKGYLHHLLGGSLQSSGPRLQEFWRRYRAWMPEHE
ncbi:unnamed protein product, partial [Symbiodinium sp. KB8]